MKISSIHTKELSLLENMMSESSDDACRHLRNMHDNSVVQYTDYLSKVKTRLDETELTPNQITQLLQQSWTEAGKPTDSAKVAELLKQQGVSDQIIASAYSAMGIPQDAPAPTKAAAGDKIEPTMDPQETAPQPPAAAGGTSIFADPKKLASDFESYMEAGGTIPPAMRGVLKDILLTALRTVENKQRKLNAIIKESKRLQKQVVELKKRKQV